MLDYEIPGICILCFSSRSRHTRCALLTGVQTCALPISGQERYVFQRTPSSVDVRDNRPTDPEWFAQIATPGWQQRWLENFTTIQTGGLVDEDLVQDGWTDLARRVQARVLSLPPDGISPEAVLEAFEDSDFEKMEEIRARVDNIVEAPVTK